MGQLINIFLLCIAISFQVLLASADIYTDIFEFGENVGKLSFSVSGVISDLAQDKLKIVPITVPACSELTYARVDVRNTVGPPSVRLDDNINAVVIKYRPLQYSRSTYVIIAKTKDVPCNQRK